MAAQEERRPVTGVAIVNERLGYPIAIGADLRSAIARFARYRAPQTIAIHDAFAPVGAYARSVVRAFDFAPAAVLPVALGEGRKTPGTVQTVQARLLAAGAGRDTLVVGVGGGVAADVFGLAAATYMRGVPYAHVATTLVAMVDAAIGGKTGANLEGAKNAVGTFTDPVAVFCPVDALFGLPFVRLREGLAEVVKSAIVEGGALFEALEELAPDPFSRWPWEALIAGTIEVKAKIVADDRLESGGRERLNLGHTFAHALEAASEYRIAHGAAVALGLRAAGLLALRTGRFSEPEHLRVLTLLALLGMPLRTSAQPKAVLAAMRADKKARGGRLRFVLPRAIGDVEYGIECPDESVLAVLDRLRRPPVAIR